MYICIYIYIFSYVQKSAKPKRIMEVVAGTGRRVGLERSAEEVGQTKEEEGVEGIEFSIHVSFN